MNHETIQCPQCFQEVDGHSAFCPSCGARLNGNALDAAVSSDDPTFADLAHANLMRLRGDWDGARERTVEVMRAFPNSATAHSLMGDICADQDQYEEAAQWYRMALDLEPNNAADARKLEHVESLLRERSATDEEEPPDRPRRIPPMLLLGWVTTLILAAVIVLGLALRPDAPPTEPAPDQGAAAPKQPMTAPRTEAFTSAPVTTPEAALRVSLDEVADSLRAEKIGLNVLGLDPRDHSARIRLVVAFPSLVGHAWRRERDAALLTARTVIERNPSVARAIVSVQVSLWTGDHLDPEVVYIAELARAETPTDEVVSEWWRPDLQPPPAPAEPETMP